MNRRSFLVSSAATAGLALLPLSAEAAYVKYTPGLEKTLLADGKTLFLDFFASWCGTCQAQRRVIEGLWQENPDYEKYITFVEIDWDTYGKGELAKALRIPRRSTLVTIAPDGREIGRVVAGTSRADIKALMDGALAVATS